VFYLIREDRGGKRDNNGRERREKGGFIFIHKNIAIHK